MRQIRWAATLLQKILPAGTPLYKVTNTNIVVLDTAFEGLSIKFGKSPRDRDAAVPLSITIAEAADALAAGLLKPTAVGLSIGTTNKHSGKLA